MFGRVAGHVGRAHERLDRVVGRAEARHADADRDTDVTLPALKRRGGRELAEPLRHLLGLVGGPVCKEDRELVTAKPPDQVVGAEVALDQLGHLSQQAVAGGMAKGVVDQLEVVDIDQQQAVAPAVGLGALHGLFDRELKAAAVEQAGKGVLHRLGLKLFVRADPGERCAQNRRDGGQDRQRGAVEPLRVGRGATENPHDLASAGDRNVDRAANPLGMQHVKEPGRRGEHVRTDLRCPVANAALKRGARDLDHPAVRDQIVPARLRGRDGGLADVSLLVIQQGEGVALERGHLVNLFSEDFEHLRLGAYRRQRPSKIVERLQPGGICPLAVGVSLGVSQQSDAIHGVREQGGDLAQQLERVLVKRALISAADVDRADHHATHDDRCVGGDADARLAQRPGLSQLRMIGGLPGDRFAGLEGALHRGLRQGQQSGAAGPPSLPVRATTSMWSPLGVSQQIETR